MIHETALAEVAEMTRTVKREAWNDSLEDTALHAAGFVFDAAGNLLGCFTHPDPHMLVALAGACTPFGLALVFDTYAMSTPMEFDEAKEIITTPGHPRQSEIRESLYILTTDITGHEEAKEIHYNSEEQTFEELSDARVEDAPGRIHKEVHRAMEVERFADAVGSDDAGLYRKDALQALTVGGHVLKQIGGAFYPTSRLVEDVVNILLGDETP